MQSPKLDRKFERGFEENLKRDCSHASPNLSEVFKFYSRLLRALGSSHFQKPGNLSTQEWATCLLPSHPFHIVETRGLIEVAITTYPLIAAD